jgi:hypothetical protein
MAKGIVKVVNKDGEHLKTFIYSTPKYVPEQAFYWIKQGLSDDELFDIGIQAVSNDNIKEFKIN